MNSTDDEQKISKSIQSTDSQNQDTITCTKCQRTINFSESLKDNDEMFHELPSYISNVNISGTRFHSSISLKEHAWQMVQNESCFENSLCKDCAEYFLSQLEEQARKLNHENKALQDAILTYQSMTRDSNNINNMENLEQETIELENQLHLAQSECDKLEEEISELEKQLDQTLKDQEKIWQYIDFNQSKEHESFLNNMYHDKYIQNLKHDIDALKKSHVLNDLFYISQDGPFGTINSFRLGKLSTSTVTWDEVNAGLGHCLLLLYLMSKNMGFEFEKYKLIPMGNMSRIDKLYLDQKDHDRSFEFYFPTTKHLDSDRCNSALVLFLDCIKQFGNFLVTLDNRFHLPFK